MPNAIPQEDTVRGALKTGAIRRALFVTAVVLVISLALLFVWQDSNIVAASLSGGVLGWFVGMLLSPKTIAESERFGGWAKGIAGFATGTLFTKLIDGASHMHDGSIWNQDVLRRTSMFFVWLMVGLINSFVFRQYNEAFAPDDLDARMKKIESGLEEVKTKIK